MSRSISAYHHNSFSTSNFKKNLQFISISLIAIGILDDWADSNSSSLSVIPHRSSSQMLMFIGLLGLILSTRQMHVSTMKHSRGYISPKIESSRSSKFGYEKIREAAADIYMNFLTKLKEQDEALTAQILEIPLNEDIPNRSDLSWSHILNIQNIPYIFAAGNSPALAQGRKLLQTLYGNIDNHYRERLTTKARFVVIRNTSQGYILGRCDPALDLESRMAIALLELEINTMTINSLSFVNYQSLEKWWGSTREQLLLHWSHEPINGTLKVNASEM